MKRSSGVAARVLAICAAGSGIAAMGLLASAAAPAEGPVETGTPRPDYSKVPVDGNGAYATGKYRNLFAERGHSEAEIDAKIAKAYQQLFHGDTQKQAIMFSGPKNDNGPTAYIVDIQHDDIRSEGMSYGMIITAELDKKDDFDAIWNWSRTYMYHDDPKHPTYGYFSWQMRNNGTAMSEMPAPDGEQYYAMALLFAANRWGSGKGIYDYKSEAMKLLHNIVHREQITGQAGGRGRGVTEGPEVVTNPPMILFSPDNQRSTDASYDLPAFYELWSRWGPPEDKEFWAKAAIASRDFFYISANAKTGLIPNQGQIPTAEALLQPPGPPATAPQAAAGQGRRGGFGGGGFGGGFQEDAWRCASNWSVDWSWWGKDPREQELSDRLQAFFESKGMDTYGDHWSLDGVVARDRHSPGLVSTNAVASLAAKDKVRADKFVDALWNIDPKSLSQDDPQGYLFQYYDGLLYMMSLMHVSGRFRVIMPKG